MIVFYNNLSLFLLSFLLFFWTSISLDPYGTNWHNSDNTYYNIKLQMVQKWFKKACLDVTDGVNQQTSRETDGSHVMQLFTHAHVRLTWWSFKLLES